MTTPPAAAIHLNIGFVPLIDSAPLLIAQAQGLFADAGLQVDLSREPSWAGIRDRTAFGVLDAAVMTAPMPLAAALGLGGPARPMVTGLVLSKGGNGITFSSVLGEQTQRDGLAATIAARRGAGDPPLTLGVVFGVSTHHYELRAWLRDQGVDPDTDVTLRVVAPPAMADALRAGTVDGYCVGAPWNHVGAALGAGHTVAYTAAPPPGRPEKVLAVNAAWANEHPRAHSALIKVLTTAGRWLGSEPNRRLAAEILASHDRLGVPADQLLPDLLRRDDAGNWHLDFGTAGHRPDPADAQPLIEAMRQAGQLAPEADTTSALAVWRPDLYDAAVATP